MTTERELIAEALYGILADHENRTHAAPGWETNAHRKDTVGTILDLLRAEPVGEPMLLTKEEARRLWLDAREWVRNGAPYHYDAAFDLWWETEKNRRRQCGHPVPPEPVGEPVGKVVSVFFPNDDNPLLEVRTSLPWKDALSLLHGSLYAVPPEAQEPGMTQEMRAAVGSTWAPNQATSTGPVEPTESVVALMEELVDRLPENWPARVDAMLGASAVPNPIAAAFVLGREYEDADADSADAITEQLERLEKMVLEPTGDVEALPIEEARHLYEHDPIFNHAVHTIYGLAQRPVEDFDAQQRTNESTLRWALAVVHGVWIAALRSRTQEPLLRKALEYLGHHDICDCRLPECSCGMRSVEQAIEERLSPMAHSEEKTSPDTATERLR